MIAMNTDHPDFDIAREFLCTLPHEDVYKASAGELADDFGMSQDGIMKLVETVQACGFLADCVIDKNTGEARIFINSFDWNKVKIEARRYWKKVYESCST